MIDSPHSGTIYPDDFGYACPKEWLAETEDGLVDQLFADAPACGVPFLKALFPRCYIDVNRAIDDIDDRLFAGPWPYGRLQPTTRSAQGFGLVRRLHKQQNPKPIYDRPLSPAAIRQRIDGYYIPYHAALSQLMDETYARFGVVYHLNCHSMPSQGRQETEVLADIVLGDRDGTSCDADFTAFVRHMFENMGYRVAVNAPYKGVEIVRRHGRPHENRHSLQIEIARALYMDESTRLPVGDFNIHKNNMKNLIVHIIDYTRNKSVNI